MLRRFGPPENEVPVAVPLNAVLARTGDVALALLRLQVYSTGLTFDLILRCRASAVSGGRGLDTILWRHGPEASPLLVGLEFPDGRRVTSAGRPFPGSAGPDDVVFHESSSSGGGLSCDQSWWLSPLPPGGPLRLVVRCEPLGIADTTTELDGAAIAAAAAGVTELWPWEPPPQMPPPGDRPPDVPGDSWFAGG